MQDVRPTLYRGTEDGEILLRRLPAAGIPSQERGRKVKLWLVVALVAAIAIAVAVDLAGGPSVRVLLYDSSLWLAVNVPVLQSPAWSVAVWIHSHLLPAYPAVP